MAVALFDALRLRNRVPESDPAWGYWDVQARMCAAVIIGRGCLARGQ